VHCRLFEGIGFGLLAFYCSCRKAPRPRR